MRRTARVDPIGGVAGHTIRMAGRRRMGHMHPSFTPPLADQRILELRRDAERAAQARMAQAALRSASRTSTGTRMMQAASRLLAGVRTVVRNAECPEQVPGC
jgi:hypothetical protein